MTWLDVLCFLVLVLVCVGGYEQGFIRGLLRLLGMLAGGTLGTIVLLQTRVPDTATGAVRWALVAALLGLCVASLLAWMAGRSIQARVHRQVVNRVLGILPALLIGLVIMAVVLSLAERVAATEEMQAFLRKGTISGPLIGTVDLLEQMVAGVR